MYWYAATLVFAGLAAGFYYFDGVNFIADKFKRFQSLNRLVATRHRNLAKILYISCVILCKAMFYTLLSYVNRTVKQLDRNTYEITFTIRGRIHKLLVKNTQGPDDIIMVINGNGDDVTDNVRPYLGPNADAFASHADQITPEFFGESELTFMMDSGEDIVIEGVSPICLIDTNEN